MSCIIEHSLNYPMPGYVKGHYKVNSRIIWTEYNLGIVVKTRSILIKRKYDLRSLCWAEILKPFKNLNSSNKHRREKGNVYRHKKGRPSNSGFINFSEYEREVR